MRPVVKQALRRLWRDATTLQIGIHPDRALVLGGVAGNTATLLGAIDGTRTVEELRETARDLGLDDEAADRLIGLLVEAAVVDDAATGRGALLGLSPAEIDRLAPDLASASVAWGRPDAGLSAMRRRRASTIAVMGAGRVGSAVATLLAAAGIGHVVVDDAEVCRPADCTPAGSSPFDTGATRAQATQAAIHRSSAAVRTTTLAGTRRVDLAVVAPLGLSHPSLHEHLLRSSTPHLLAAVRETTGVVGPLVVPGVTACLRCLDLHRTDRDPAWPLLAAQLTTDGGVRATAACDVALATLVASMAALQVLAAIDGDDAETRWSPAGRWTRLPTRDGTLELTLPDWRVRRRSWSAHPACGCQWSQSQWSQGGPADETSSRRPTDAVPSGRMAP